MPIHNEAKDCSFQKVIISLRGMWVDICRLISCRLFFCNKLIHYQLTWSVHSFISVWAVVMAYPVIGAVSRRHLTHCANTPALTSPARIKKTSIHRLKGYEKISCVQIWEFISFYFFPLPSNSLTLPLSPSPNYSVVYHYRCLREKRVKRLKRNSIGYTNGYTHSE